MDKQQLIQKVKQLTGEYRIKDKKLIVLAREIKELEKEIDLPIFKNYKKTYILFLPENP